MLLTIYFHINNSLCYRRQITFSSFYKWLDFFPEYKCDILLDKRDEKYKMHTNIKFFAFAIPWYQFCSKYFSFQMPNVWKIKCRWNPSVSISKTFFSCVSFFIYYFTFQGKKKEMRMKYKSYFAISDIFDNMRNKYTKYQDILFICAIVYVIYYRNPFCCVIYIY